MYRQQDWDGAQEALETLLNEEPGCLLYEALPGTNHHFP